MLINAVILSLQITAIHVAFSDGNIFSFIRIFFANILDKIFGVKASRYIQSPLWDCPFCMSSVWTIAFTWTFDWRLILVVCGISFIQDKITTLVHELANPMERNLKQKKHARIVKRLKRI